MVRNLFSSAFSAALVAACLAAPAGAQDLGDIVGGVARQYLSQEQDRAAFAQARSSNTLRAYEAYLQQFPNGAYAGQARDQIDRLGGGTAATRPAPGTGGGAEAGLTRQQRITVQRQLNMLGYSTNGADGSFGPGTRRAVGLWQRDRGYAQTGSLSSAQANEILRGARSDNGSPAPTAAGIGPADAEADLGLGPTQRAAIQAELTRRGFDTRGIDGSFGRGTRNAISGWQRASGMSVTGYLTAAQVDSLMR